MITTGNDIRSHHVINYQLQMLKLAIDKIENNLGINRHIVSSTYGLSKKMFEQFKEKSREFRKQLTEMAQNDTAAEAVYQLNLTLLPMSVENQGEQK